MPWKSRSILSVGACLIAHTAFADTSVACEAAGDRVHAACLSGDAKGRLEAANCALRGAAEKNSCNARERKNEQRKAQEERENEDKKIGPIKAPDPYAGGGKRTSQGSDGVK